MPHWSQPKVVGAQKTRSRSKGAQEAPRGPAAGDLAYEEIPHRADVYLNWAVLTKWRGYARAGKGVHLFGGENAIRIIGYAEPTALAKAKDLLTIPPPYLRQESPEVYFTATVERSRLRELLNHPEIEWELAMPLRDASQPRIGSSSGYFGREADLQPYRKGRNSFKDITPSQPKVVSTGGLLAVIDHGCPFLQSAFAECGYDATNFPRAAGKTRLVAVWDQTTGGDLPGQKSSPPKPWRRPDGFSYGNELSAASIEALRRRLNANVNDESSLYRRLGTLINYTDPRRRVHFATHGAHVLDVVGGTIDPLLPGRKELDEASQAALAFVNLPELTAVDSSGGSLSAYLLDAVHYTLSLANPDVPVVVNISYGGTAGPHDGSSMIERAFDDLLKQRTNLAIVLGAGNARRSGCHVRRKVRPLRSALLRLDVPPGDSTDTFVELWYDKPPEGSSVKARVRRPSGDWSEWIGQGNEVALIDSEDGDVLAALIHREVPLSQRRQRHGMLLFALAPTAPPEDDGARLCEPGYWEIEVQLVPSDSSRRLPSSVGLDLHAWIERDDPADRYGGRAPSFFGLQPGDADDTLSSIATGDGTIVVGGYRHSDGLPAGYSSIGPRRKEQLGLVYALCEWDEFDPGIRAAAVRSGERLLMNGTSVAAPVFARRLFNWLTRQDNGRPNVNKSVLASAIESLAAEDRSFVRLPASTPE